MLLFYAIQPLNKRPAYLLLHLIADLALCVESCPHLHKHTALLPATAAATPVIVVSTGPVLHAGFIDKGRRGCVCVCVCERERERERERGDMRERERERKRF